MQNCFAGSGQSGTFLDMFAGAGGLSLGLMLAGWRGLFAVEKDPFAFGTLRTNLINGKHGVQYAWPDWLTKEPCAIGKFLRTHKGRLKGLCGKVDLIAGGPPCQGFSLAGNRDKYDGRNRMIHQYIEVVEHVRPPLILLENVKGIAIEFGKKKRESENKRGIGRPPTPFAEKIRRRLEGINYRVFPGLVKAVDYGVPQFRPRYFLFGVRQSFLEKSMDFDPFSLLAAKRARFLKMKGLPQDRPVTVRDAISDLETRGGCLIDCIDAPGCKQITYEGPETYYQILLHGSMNGNWPNSLRLANHRRETRSRFKRILKTCRRGVQMSEDDRKRLGIKKMCVVPLDGDKPSHTLTTLPDDLLHYAEPRILTVREYARLQSFPDWYEFKGSYTTGGDRRARECPRYTQVGNAVPPLLSELLGYVLYDLLMKLRAKA